MRLFCDMDGVLADFDWHYRHHFGVQPIKADDNVDWSLVRACPRFFEDMPLMPDMERLWDYLAPWHPTILTGCPASVNAAANEKHHWVAEHLGAGTPIICCRSRDKWRYCSEGDIIIDDWGKYQADWQAAGGHWVLHRDATSSIERLRDLGLVWAGSKFYTPLTVRPI